MSKKQEFIDYLSSLINVKTMPEGARDYWEAFISSDETVKPMFTDNGKMILEFLQSRLDEKMWKAKDIAEEIGVSSRTVSGAIRKLVTDGFVEKLGQNPTIYSITEKGKNIDTKGEN